MALVLIIYTNSIVLGPKKIWMKGDSNLDKSKPPIRHGLLLRYWKEVISYTIEKWIMQALLAGVNSWRNWEIEFNVNYDSNINLASGHQAWLIRFRYAWLADSWWISNFTWNSSIAIGFLFRFGIVGTHSVEFLKLKKVIAEAVDMKLHLGNWKY